MEEKEISKYNFKGLFKYISDVFSWTLFTLLVLIASFLLYYFVSVRLYATKGDKFEPKFSIYTIVSPSMEPTINVYDVIVNMNVDSDKVKVNDVITFISTSKITYGMTMTHRVVKIKETADGSKCFVTRGDNNTNEDEACVEKNNLIGVVKAVIPGLGKIQSILASPIGWVMLIIFPAIIILVKDLIKIFKLSKGIKDDDGKEKRKIINDPRVINYKGMKRKMSNELYTKIYNYVKTTLYGVDGLKIRLYDNVPFREEKMAKNLEVFTFISSNMENEKIIINKIIEKGIKDCQDWQYIVNEENIKKFLTGSAINLEAVRQYDNYLKELEEQSELKK